MVLGKNLAFYQTLSFNFALHIETKIKQRMVFL
jgi:hypothetical protein